MYREELISDSVIDTFSVSQNAGGGFGGGFGQLSHCAASYAAILCLSMVGGSEALDLIDRRALCVCPVVFQYLYSYIKL